MKPSSKDHNTCTTFLKYHVIHTYIELITIDYTHSNYTIEDKSIFNIRVQDS